MLTSTCGQRVLPGPCVTELCPARVRCAPFHIRASSNHFTLHPVPVPLFYLTSFPIKAFVLLHFPSKHLCCSVRSLSRCINWPLHFSCTVFSVTPLMQCAGPTAYISLHLHLATLRIGSQGANGNSVSHTHIPFDDARLLERVSCPHVNSFGKTKSPYRSCSSTVCFFSVKKTGSVGPT